MCWEPQVQAQGCSWTYHISSWLQFQQKSRWDSGICSKTKYQSIMIGVCSQRFSRLAVKFQIADAVVFFLVKVQGCSYMFCMWVYAWIDSGSCMDTSESFPCRHPFQSWYAWLFKTWRQVYDWRYTIYGKERTWTHHPRQHLLLPNLASLCRLPPLLLFRCQPLEHAHMFK